MKILPHEVDAALARARNIPIQQNDWTRGETLAVLAGLVIALVFVAGKWWLG